MADLEIRDLHVSVGGSEILKGVSLDVNRGEVNAIMGPNGSGKSSLAFTLMGHPGYHITSGTIRLFGQDIISLKPHKRARLGLFLSFQYPQTIPGVSVSNFLRTALNSRREKDVPVPDFLRLLKEKMELLKIDRSFASRSLNDGFSGGEKKRVEILQMAVLQPAIAILDETDSGLDVDALRTVASGVNSLRGPGLGILLITHYQRLLNHVIPDRVHILMNGRIVLSGDKQLALEIEHRGYDWIAEKPQQPSARAP